LENSNNGCKQANDHNDQNPLSYRVHRMSFSANRSDADGYGLATGHNASGRRSYSRKRLTGLSTPFRNDSNAMCEILVVMVEPIWRALTKLLKLSR